MPTVVSPLADIAKEAKQDSILTELQGQQKDALTDAELRAAAVVVDTQLTIPTPQTDALTDAELRAAAVATAETHSALVKGTVTAANSGDTIVHTPQSGKKIRLYFFGYSGGADITGNLLSLRLEGYESDATIDRQYLSAEGQPYARNMKAGTGYIEGGVDGRLIVNLSAAQTVYVNYELEEV